MTAAVGTTATFTATATTTTISRLLYASTEFKMFSHRN
jgi:hypothetical protein